MDILVDTSWTLHRVRTNSAPYKHLFTRSTTQTHLSRHFDRLPTFLSSRKPKYVDDLDDRNEKLGPLRECKCTVSQVRSPDAQHTIQTQRVVRIQLLYQATTFTFALYSPYLLLSKAPASHTSQFIAFLSETFDVSIAALKLPSSLLCTVLQRYISTVAHTDPDDDDDDFLRPERRAATLRTAVGTLKLTITFAGAVKAHLRTLDLGVPCETVEVLTSGVGGEGFAADLARYIYLQTGLRLPLTAAEGVDGGDKDKVVDGRAGSVASESDAEPPLKLSKMTCAAFAISIDGRLKFTGKAVDSTANQDDLVSTANTSILQTIVTEAQNTDH